ncbi:hypothetical protein TPY_0499 [Sulfobacillus acidophilus TPY]|nr:hypothetical protein TPY_0499 [Sulfobacillus acidophilus TPY]
MGYCKKHIIYEGGHPLKIRFVMDTDYLTGHSEDSALLAPVDRQDLLIANLQST